MQKNNRCPQYGSDTCLNNDIYTYADKFIAQVIDEKEQKCFDAIYQDMKEHLDKYSFNELYLITRERVVELIKLGLEKEKEN